MNIKQAQELKPHEAVIVRATGEEVYIVGGQLVHHPTRRSITSVILQTVDGRKFDHRDLDIRNPSEDL